jgi:MFS family permease
VNRLGGVLTDRASWRWCFWLNLPLGAITALFMTIFFKDSKKRQKVSPGRLKQINQIDPLGIAAFIPAIISLLLTLQWGGTKYDWTNSRIIALFILFAVFGTLWCAIQLWKQDDATVPPRLLKDRNVLGAVIHATFLGGSFFVFGYYVSEWIFSASKDRPSHWR